MSLDVVVIFIVCKTEVIEFHRDNGVRRTKIRFT